MIRGLSELRNPFELNAGEAEWIGLLEPRDLERMSREELLGLRSQIDALLVQQELEGRRSPSREVVETRRIPGAVLRLELLRRPDGSASGPHWFRYSFRGEPPRISIRYLGESPPDEKEG